VDPFLAEEIAGSNGGRHCCRRERATDRRQRVPGIRSKLEHSRLAEADRLQETPPCLEAPAAAAAAGGGPRGSAGTVGHGESVCSKP
jgi:hypothetical protein